MSTAPHLDQFASLFTGWDKALGYWDPKGETVKDGVKLKGKSWTVAHGPSAGDYTAHLAGVRGLGIVLLTDEHTVHFGALDRDQYTGLDHGELAKRIAALKLPMVVCRSKSGGAHVYVFFSTPQPAAAVRTWLEHVRVLLGWPPKTEVFPKQTGRASPEDVGNWINLPYFAAEHTLRAAYSGKTGQPLTLVQFLAVAAKLRQASVPPLPTAPPDDLFFEGPPCLQTLHQQGGFVQGTKNDGLMAVVRYLRLRYPDDWQNKVTQYAAAMAPGAPAQELTQLTKTNEKKEYKYRCKQAPLAEVCQRSLCLQRVYGIRPASELHQQHDVEITGVTRYTYEGLPYEESRWGLEANGVRIMLSTTEFYDLNAVNRAFLSRLGVLAFHGRPGEWRLRVSELGGKAPVVELPPDLSVLGHLWEHIEAYLLNAKCTAMDQIVAGGAYRDGGTVWFRSKDLVTWLNQRRIKYPNEFVVRDLLSQRGGEGILKSLAGTKVRVWQVPLEAPQLPATTPDAETHDDPF